MNLAYVLLRLPFAVIYAGILGLVVFRVADIVLFLVLLVPAGLAI